MTDPYLRPGGTLHSSSRWRTGTIRLRRRTEEVPGGSGGFRRIYSAAGLEDAQTAMDHIDNPVSEAPLNPRARFQFSVRRMMVVVAGVASTLAYLANGSTKLGCGSATVQLTFHVVDDRNGRPIAGAKVKFGYDLSAPMASVITGTDGFTSATCQTGCTSYSGPFFRRYRCLNYGEGLWVEALGYQPLESLLRHYTTYPAYHDTSSPPPIVVRMKR